MKVRTVVSSGASISPDGRFRFRLWRRWDTGPMCVWVMLNPSTADASQNDATIRRCMGFANLWGYAGIEVVNLYALRSTDPKVMLAAPDRTGGAVNRRAHVSALKFHRNAVCAWGNNAESPIANGFLGWAEAEIGYENVVCLGVTKMNHPKHPVRLPYSAGRVPVAIAQGRQR